jgi:hypothetical protein
VEAVLNQLADSLEWWPAFSAVTDALPSPRQAIGQDSPWSRIKSGSVRAWAERVALAYWNENWQAMGKTQRIDDDNLQSLVGQATRIVLANGDDFVSLPRGQNWNGQRCLQRLREQRSAA